MLSDKVERTYCHQALPIDEAHVWCVYNEYPSNENWLQISGSTCASI